MNLSCIQLDMVVWLNTIPMMSIRVPDIIIMNDAIKEQLTDEQEKAIEEAAKESTVLKLKLLQKQLKKKSFSTRRTWSPIQ